MEQIRIVKEMRERERATGRTGWMVRPRYMVWENVPGAFSSGNPKGADFAAVIEEIIKVAEPGAAVSVCVPNGGWTKSGCYYAEDGSWSIAWRVHDAQFWGVPQRRKRISLVSDFGGLSAPEILFERKGLSGDSEQSRAQREETAGATGEGVTGAIGFTNRGFESGDVTETLRSDPHGAYPMVAETISFQERCGKPGNGKGILIQHEHDGSLSTLNDQSVLSFDPTMSRYAGTVFKDVAKTLTPGTSPGHHDAICTKEQILLESNQNHATVQTDGISTALPASMGMGGGYVPMIVGCDVYNQEIKGNGDGKTVCTITGDHQNRVTDYTALCVGNGQANQSVSDKAGALNTMHDQQAVMVLPFDTTQITSPQNGNSPHYGDPCHPLAAGAHAPSVAMVTAVDCRNGTENQQSNGSLQAKASNNLNSNNVCRVNSIVRRLTPLECERLQGYPDGWTDIGEWTGSKGKKHGEADSPRYKALGNSIALPFWQWMARRICAQYERPATMASLFDGIGGFPLVFQRCGAVPVWASEIEEFPIAVTKVRFPDESM